MQYRKLFDPDAADRQRRCTEPTEPLADRAAPAMYVYAEEITLAVNVALTTARPLLVRGPSGTGKSSLAASVANVLGWAYAETVITSRTQARDLMWQVDLLRRLQDAQIGKLQADWRTYVSPGVLWWAFDPEGAQRQLRASAGKHVSSGIRRESAESERTVVLLDEIDKADPDVPNDLLKPLGTLMFDVEELGETVQAKAPPLVLISTNEERDLPPAFLRRCVELTIPRMDESRLERIGQTHFPDCDPEVLAKVAELMVHQTRRRGALEGPNAGEYLDMVRACRELDV